MTELPRTDDLPRTGEGYDPPRVEEAFASFGDRVRELETVAAELRAELRSLRAERAAAFAAPEADPDWPAEGAIDGSGLGASPDWVAGAFPPPIQRPFTVPRLALEAVFLLVVALLAGLADLAPEWIALVMGVAWLVVALVEWSNAARRARWRLDEIPPPLEPAATGDATGRWSAPVVEATALAQPEVSESRTVVTRQPAEAEPAEAAAPADAPQAPQAAEAPEAATEDTEETEAAEAPEETGEPEKPRRRGLFGRRVPEHAPPEDSADSPDGLPELPAAAAEDSEEAEAGRDLEDTGERPATPMRRGLFRRRRNPESAAPADPWEA
jgi:hypothetical protein